MRIVLDTNILISALFFKGELCRFHNLWKSGKITPLLTRETFGEFQKVLEYPKFKLTKDKIQFIIYEEILPYFEIVEVKKEIKGVSKDPDDDKFISCAVNGNSEYIISGDGDLPDISKYRKIVIISPGEFLKNVV
jgi:uncharacterized protein